MTKQYVQAGFNPFYPNSIETWKWTTKESPPEWLIDYCRVRNIDLDGKTELEYRKTKSGGVELVLSRTDSYIPILINNPETDSICFDFMSKKLFILTKKELNMLYKEA